MFHCQLSIHTRNISLYLTSYIKANKLVLERFKITWYLLDRLNTYLYYSSQTLNVSDLFNVRFLTYGQVMLKSAIPARSRKLKLLNTSTVHRLVIEGGVFNLKTAYQSKDILISSNIVLFPCVLWESHIWLYNIAP